MAAITSAVVGGVAAAGSAYSSYRGAKDAKRQADQANANIVGGQINPFSISGPGGIFAGFDPRSGQIQTQLGGRLTGQQGIFDSLGQGFLQQMGQNSGGPLSGILRNIGGAIGGAPGGNEQFFGGLQNQVGAGLGAARGNLQDALGGIAPGLSEQAFGLAGQQFGDIGNGEMARDRALGLMREQARPFEDRAFSNLQENLHSTGRLGTTGGGLQTEAFARGLGQADLARQLAASDEGRAYQQNAYSLGRGLGDFGVSERLGSGSLLSSAFSNFGNFAGLASDVEGRRYGQQMGSQQNLVNQLQGLFGSTLAGQGFQSNEQQRAFGNILSSFGAGNSLTNIPLDWLQAGSAMEGMRSNASLGVGTSQLYVPSGGGTDALGAAFSGLSGAAQSGGLSNFMNTVSGFFRPPAQMTPPGDGVGPY